MNAGTTGTGEPTNRPLLAHIAKKAEVTRAYIEGTPLRALCGVEFIPSRDPDECPPCTDCSQILTENRRLASDALSL